MGKKGKRIIFVTAIFLICYFIATFIFWWPNRQYDYPMNEALRGGFWLFVIGLLALPPFIVTIINAVRLIRCLMGKEAKRPFTFVDCYTIIGGAALSGVLYMLMGYPDYEKPLIINNTPDFHAPLFSQSLVTVVLLAIIGISGYMFLRMKKQHPPLALTFIMASTFMGVVLALLWIIQLSKNIVFSFEVDQIAVILFLLYPINYIMLCVIATRKAVSGSVAYEGKNKILLYLSRFVNKASTSWLWALGLLFPLYGIIIAILALFGQRPDSIITAFTQTSDWTLSQQVSPPPISAGHYLCTVAATGHKRLVKPIRFGVRRGYVIIVNRQLMIANAFEDLLAERMPRTHKRIRSFYDRYGYPISKHITNKFRADIIYLLMKPLEWIFLSTLYLFDLKPENRITRQYSGQNHEKLI